MTPTIYYCYDAYCGWCYGFSPVIKKVWEEYKDRLAFDVLSGGMIINENPVSIRASAGYIAKAYKQVEALTGIVFGKDYLWHIINPGESDWYPSSEKPAIALSVFKDYHEDKAVAFAADLQHALHYDGRDLTDDEAYRHLLEQYDIPAEEFYKKLHSAEYKEQAYYDFALCKQLNVTGFPQVLIQVAETKFYLLAQGFTTYEDLKDRIEKVLVEIAAA
ncbi:MAG: DsbA family protein [Bacteroidota bacterium]